MAQPRDCQSCSEGNCPAKQRRDDESSQEFQERQQLMRRMCQIAHKILILSGKGGVGKSTVAVNLAVSLAMQKKRVGLLDIDVHGPSIPTLLGVHGVIPVGTEEALLPVEVGPLKVMSIGFLLRSSDDAVIWRGPLKHGVIKQFLKDVEWGELDYLIVDSPPGTGDEPLSIAQLIPQADGAVVVTTPQELSVADVRKCVTFCRKVGLNVLGVVENMSGFVCPNCGAHTDIFKTKGGEKMARAMGVPFLGAIPIDPEVVAASDEGRPFVQHYAQSATAKAFEEIVSAILGMTETNEPSPSAAG